MTPTTFYVTGRGAFPVDMLRYDRAWPVDHAAQRMVVAEAGSREVITGMFRCVDQPTFARWSSFLFAAGLYDPRSDNFTPRG